MTNENASPEPDGVVRAARLLASAMLLATSGLCLSLANGDFGILASPFLFVAAIVIGTRK